MLNFDITPFTPERSRTDEAHLLKDLFPLVATVERLTQSFQIAQAIEKDGMLSDETMRKLTRNNAIDEEMVKQVNERLLQNKNNTYRLEPWGETADNSGIILSHLQESRRFGDKYKEFRPVAGRSIAPYLDMTPNIYSQPRK